MRRLRIRPALLVILLAVAAALTVSATAFAHHRTVEGLTTGTDGSGGPSNVLESADGSVVAWDTQENIGSDVDNDWDVYVGAPGGTPTRASATQNGAPVGFPPRLKHLSADGDYVTFETDAALLASDTDSVTDVYQYRRSNTTLTNLSDDGTDAAQPATWIASSADGQRTYIGTSEALAAPDADGAGDYDVFVNDHGTLEQVSVTSAGANSTSSSLDYSGIPGQQSMSSDGSRFYFTSFASYDAGDADAGKRDVYVRDIVANTTTLLSGGETATGVNAHVFDEYVTSADGSHILVRTDNAYDAADTNGNDDLYEVTLPAGTKTWISHGPSGSGVLGGSLAISANGSVVTFADDFHLTAAATTGNTGLYVRSGGTTTLVTDGAALVYGGTSSDGSTVVFSTTDALTAADTDVTNDLYGWRSGTFTLLSGSTSSSASLEVGGIASDGSAVVFQTSAKLLPTDTDTQTDIYEYVDGTLQILTQTATGGNANSTADLLATSFPSGLSVPPALTGVSADLSRVTFITDEALLASDTDIDYDAYRAPRVSHAPPVDTGGTGGGGGSTPAQEPAPTVSGVVAKSLGLAKLLAGKFTNTVDVNKKATIDEQLLVKPKVAKGLGVRAAKLVVLGTGRASAAGAGRVTVKVKLTAKAKKALKKHRKAFTATLSIKVTDSTGHVATTTKQVKITR